MTHVSEWLSCIPVEADGFSISPIGTEEFLVKTSVDKELAKGLNTAEQNCLTRALEPWKPVILASLGYGHGFKLSIAVGERFGRTIVTYKKETAATETLSMVMPEVWSDIVHMIDMGSPIVEGWKVELAVQFVRPAVSFRVRQTTVDDVRRAVEAHLEARSH